MVTRILGIDPGSRITGFGIIEIHKHHQKYITSGCIRLKSSCANENLNQIFSAIQTVIEKYSPHEAAIEQIFMHNNPGSAIKLGQARGAAIVAMTQKGLTVSQYSARQIKQSVVGYGAAKKEQVQHMICKLLNLTGQPQADAADALAVAICHANSRGLGNILNITGLRHGRLRNDRAITRNSSRKTTAEFVD
ncbi:MAG: crossover junction endodeoxyribonuclease RuvC [Gammaproteobacteria bacterium]|nr:crossover junction endodeoxyribonuclease RuvC [Gammaproteobacteria bacterium]